MSDLTNRQIRDWTTAALAVRQHVPAERLDTPSRLFIVELLHARASAASERGEEVFSIQTDLLASVLARLLRKEIVCANGADHAPPIVPESWNCEDVLFCADCIDSASREDV